MSRTYLHVMLYTGELVADKNPDNPGALMIATFFSESSLKRVLALGRLAYDGKTRLVPGMPEADSEGAALYALAKWIKLAINQPREQRRLALESRPDDEDGEVWAEYEEYEDDEDGEEIEDWEEDEVDEFGK